MYSCIFLSMYFCTMNSFMYSCIHACSNGCRALVHWAWRDCGPAHHLRSLVAVGESRMFGPKKPFREKCGAGLARTSLAEVRQVDRQTQREREIERDRDREREIQIENERDRESDRQRERYRDTETRDRVREKQRDKQ